MAKMEKFSFKEEDLRKREAMPLLISLIDAVQVVTLQREKLNSTTSFAYEPLLKVCRKKLANCASELDTVVGILQKMSSDPEYLKDSEPEDIEKEIEKLTYPYENEM